MSDKKLFQRIIIFASAIAFLGSTGAFIIGMFVGANQTPETASTEAITVDQELVAREKGFEQVLAREPDNQFALQGLVDTRLAMQDYQAAIAPMQKLIELNPEQEEYQTLLTAIQQQAASTSVEIPIENSDSSDSSDRQE